MPSELRGFRWGALPYPAGFARPCSHVQGERHQPITLQGQLQVGERYPGDIRRERQRASSLGLATVRHDGSANGEGYACQTGALGQRQPTSVGDEQQGRMLLRKLLGLIDSLGDVHVLAACRQGLGESFEESVVGAKDEDHRVALSLGLLPNGVVEQELLQVRAIDSVHLHGFEPAAGTADNADA